LCLALVIGAVLFGACGRSEDRLSLAPAQPLVSLPQPGATEGAPLSSEGFNPTLLNLPERQWVRVEPNPSKRYIPRRFQSSEILEDDPNPQGRDYSGILYGDGKLFYFGGGHGGYMGNDVEVYDIRRNVWTQSYRPDVAPENTPDTGWRRRLAPGRRPWVEHSYQVGCYDPTTRAVLWLLQYGGTIRFDPNTSEWTPLAGPHAGGTGSDALVTQYWGVRACLGYDPDLRTLLAIETSTFGGVFAWRGRSWSRHSGIPPFKIHYRTPYTAYMPDQHKYFVWNGYKWWTYDAVNKRWAELPAPPGAHLDSFDYDTVNGVIVGANYGPGLFRMWAVKPAENQWTELPVGSTHPDQPIGAASAAPLLRYDRIHNVFLFLVFRPGAGGTSRPTELWAWRYKTAPPR